MRRQAWLTFLLVLLAAAALGWGALLAGALVASRPPLRQPAAPGQALPPLAARVVFVIVDGLRNDVAQDLPCLRQIGQAGAWAQARAALPTMSQADWTTLVTGARPEISGAPFLNNSYDQIRPIAVDNLLGVAKEAGLRTALAGHTWWRKMVPAADLDQAGFVPAFDAAGDAAATEAALAAWRGLDRGLLLVYLGEYDDASHAWGALSPQARAAADRIDRHLCALAAAVDRRDTVLIVTADHGALGRGGHGGNEAEVLAVPLVLAGRAIRPGAYAQVEQPDVAMTIAALLGTRLPRSGQGRVLYEMLDVSPAQQAAGLAALAAQKQALASGYLQALGLPSLPADLAPRVARVRTSQPRDSRLAGQESLAFVDAVEGYVGGERRALFEQGRRRRLALVLAGLAAAGAAGILYWRRNLGRHSFRRRGSGLPGAAGAGEPYQDSDSRQYRLPLLLAPLGFVLYHAIYLARGQIYSLSTLSSTGDGGHFTASLLLGAGGALALGLAVLPAAARRGSAPAAPRLAAYGLALAALFWLQALCAWVNNAPIGAWNYELPPSAFLALLGLAQAALVSLLSLALLAGAQLQAGRGQNAPAARLDSWQDKTCTP